AYFSQRVQKIVTKHGKAVIGWDEVLVPGVPKDIVIQSWRGQESLAKAAKEGYRNPFERVLPRSRLERRAALRGRSHERPRGGPDSRREKIDPRRRGVHVVRVRGRRKYRFPHLAPHCRHRGASVVAANSDRSRFDVRAHGRRKREAGMAGADAPHLLPKDAAANCRPRDTGGFCRVEDPRWRRRAGNGLLARTDGDRRDD